MKRLSVAITALALLAMAASSLAVHAQGPEAVPLAQAYTAAINARDAEGALALFADDGVVVGAAGQRLAGRELIRAGLEAAVAGNPYELLVGEPQVVGGTVTWLRDRYDDTSRNLGAAPMRSVVEAVVERGKIQSLSSIASPETEARLEAAQAVLAVVQAYEAALNAGDVDAALALFADDAVGVTADGQRWSGKEQIRVAVQSSVTPRAQTERVRYQVAGDRVTSVVNISSQGLQALGVAALQVSAETMVRGGKIRSTTSTFTPESAARLQAAQNRAVAAAFLDLFNAHDLNGLIDLLAPTFVDRDAPTGQDPGAEGTRAGFSMLFEGAPDVSASMDLVVSERDLVLARFTFRGTHSGELFGVPATGRQFAVTAMDVLRIQGGKIVEHWGNFDELGLLRQLGGAP